MHVNHLLSAQEVVVWMLMNLSLPPLQLQWMFLVESPLAPALKSVKRQRNVPFLLHVFWMTVM